jgi:hypothetical protein
MKQHGGEGTESYKGKKTNKGLSQHGGEGKGRGKAGKDSLLRPDSGPGGKLGIVGK